MSKVVRWLKSVAQSIATQREKILDLAKYAAKNGGDRTARRVGSTGIFFITDWVLSKPFDYILFPYVLLNYSWLLGVPFLTLCNFFYCLGSIHFYDYLETDALVVEDIKSLRDYEGNAPFKKFWSWMLRKGWWASFLALSIKYDPAFTVIFFRKSGKHYSGIQDKKSWSVFLSSLVVNMWWCFPAFGLGKFGYPILVSSLSLYGAVLANFAIVAITLFVLLCALWYWLVLTQKEH